MGRVKIYVLRACLRQEDAKEKIFFSSRRLLRKDNCRVFCGKMIVDFLSQEKYFSLSLAERQLSNFCGKMIVDFLSQEMIAAFLSQKKYCNLSFTERRLLIFFCADNYC